MDLNVHNLKFKKWEECVTNLESHILYAVENISFAKQGNWKILCTVSSNTCEDDKILQNSNIIKLITAVSCSDDFNAKMNLINLT